MSRLKQVEAQIEAFSAEELRAFREWFYEFDNDLWDRQMEADSRSGKFEAAFAEALREHAEGKTTPL